MLITCADFIFSLRTRCTKAAAADGNKLLHVYSRLSHGLIILHTQTLYPVWKHLHWLSTRLSSATQAYLCSDWSQYMWHSDTVLIEWLHNSQSAFVCC